MSLTTAAIIIAGTTFTGLINGWLTRKWILNFLSAFNPLNNNTSPAMNLMKTELTQAVAANISTSINENGFLEKKLSDPSLFEKLRPEIEKYVDHFLEHKLSAVFPLLYKFMGEKTLSQFKQAFLEETDILFPEMMKKYATELKAGMGVQQITETLTAFDFPAERFKPLFSKMFVKLLLLNTIAGLMIGLLVVLISTKLEF